MELRRRIEQALASSLDRATSAPCPPRLGQAMRHAVFPGGARFRPELCITVADACGAADPQLAEVAAVAIELLHCASLVYDDLPCFDDAPLRRGVTAVHMLYGQELAVLAGNALTVLAFETLAHASSPRPEVVLALVRTIAGGVGSSWGIVAGQAWESEAVVEDIAAYHRAKTGALFEAAILAGAIVGCDESQRWRGLGYRLGEAYQIADDLRDACGSAEALGKPVGQDLAHGRPSAARALGAAGCVRRIAEIVADVRAQVPSCPGRGQVLALVRRLELQLQAQQPANSPGAAQADSSAPSGHARTPLRSDLLP